jgi:hypothetical protein
LHEDIECYISETEIRSFTVAPFTTSAHLADVIDLPLPLFCASGLSIPPDIPLSNTFRNARSKKVLTSEVENPDEVPECVIWWEGRSASVQVLLDSFPSELCLEYARYVSYAYHVRRMRDSEEDNLIKRNIFRIADEVPLTLSSKDGYQLLDANDAAEVFVSIQDDSATL